MIQKFQWNVSDASNVSTPFHNSSSINIFEQCRTKSNWLKTRAIRFIYENSGHNQNDDICLTAYTGSWRGIHTAMKCVPSIFYSLFTRMTGKFLIPGIA